MYRLSYTLSAALVSALSFLLKQIYIRCTDYRHSWIIEADVVDSTAGQMDPSALDAIQNDGGGHHEIQHEIDRVQPLQSLRLRQRSRESCQDTCARV